MLLHHSHDRRSWTDISTNYTYLGTVDLEQDVDALLDWGRIPERILPAFLHEATHHWSFHSPVGAAIATLRLGVISRALSLRFAHEGTVGQEIYNELIELNRRLVVVTELLRPLFEGLALFAEYDSIGQPSDMQGSKPMMDATLLFANPPLLIDYTGSHESMLRHGFEFLWQATHEPLLLGMRSSPECVQRKLNVLCSPLGSRQGGGYLVGYLAVCNMWKYLSGAMGNFRLLRQSDLFMTFLNHYFFWDYALVQKLLDSGVEGTPALENIARHIQSRIQDFWGLTHEKVEEFRLSAAPLEDKEALGTNSEETAAGRRLLEDFKTIHPVTDKVLPGLAVLLEDFSRNRDLIYLGQSPARIDVTGGRYKATTETGQLIAEGPVSDEDEVLSEDGFITVFYSTDDFFSVPLLRIALNDGSTIGVQASGALINAAGSSFERLKARMASRLATEDAIQAADAILEQIESPGHSDPNWTHFKEVLIPERVDAIWQIAALASVPSDKRDECRERMSEYGLLGLDPDGGEPLEAFVLSSLVASVTPYGNSVKNTLAARGYDFAEMWLWLERMWDTWGMPKLAGGNRYVQAQF